MLKRGYYGTYHRLSPFHLQKYVNEFAGRHNQRPMDTIEQIKAMVRGLAAAFASRVGSCSAPVPAPPENPRTPFPLAIDVSPLPVPAPGAACRLPVPLRVLGTYIVLCGRVTASPCRVDDLVLLAYGLLGA